MLSIGFDEALVEAVLRSTAAGLQMASVRPKPVGVALYPARTHEITVVVGLVGRRTGTVTLNLSRRAVLYLANQFLGSDDREVNEEVLDAAAEITNIVAGRLKAELSDQDYGISNISCPSLIVGGDYQMYNLRGFKTASVEFELEGVPIVYFRDRLFSTTVSVTQA